MSGASFLTIDDPSRVAESRRIATQLAEREGLAADAVGRVSIVATELASNLWKHAKRGELHIAPLSERGETGIEILSIDRGPGISNLDECFKDGHSTAGTAGTGLGAVRRLSDDFDIMTQPGKGTILVSQIGQSRRLMERARFRFGLASRPVGGETVSGDSWAVKILEDATLIVVADGLGHGPLAADASRAAIKSFRSSDAGAPADLVQEMHRALRGTRGAAVAVARVEFGRARVHFAGLGNIAGSIISSSKCHSMVSHNGTAGHEARHIREFEYPWTDESMIVMHSDGLSTSWNAGSFPGLHRYSPSVVGALLYREAARERDDACIVVGKYDLGRSSSNAAD